MNTPVKAPPISKIEYHADDFGLFPAQSRRILNCHSNGLLNGISIMPNSEYLSECMQLLYPVLDQMEVTVHLNIIEGRSLCSGKEIPLLANSDGIFHASFGSLLLHSFLPSRKAYRKQLKMELRSQILAVKQSLPQNAPLRLDGHAHYHMLPVVFDALMDVIQEDKLQISYIRLPQEDIGLYLRHLNQLHDLSPINWVKVLILNILVARNRHKYHDYLSSLEQKLFLGVFLSGRMYRENVMPILPDALEKAKKRGYDLEILAHPGGVSEPEDIAKITNPDDLSFLTSPFRDREATLFARH